jgi:hypothetical protein
VFKLTQYVPASLLSRARELEALREAFETCVDHSLYRHCTPLHLDNGILYVGCDSAIWAGRMRLLARSLAPRLASSTGLTVRKVEPLVRPERARYAPRRAPAKPPPVPPDVVGHLESTARGIRDPALGGALQRLADRLAKRARESD